MSETFELTDRNRVRRVAKRGVYDKQAVFDVIDAAWIGHVAIKDVFDSGQAVTVIPMLHARLNDALVFHGATSSRLMKYLGSGQPVSVSFAMVDGLVLAKSLFHHSMNYRSAVIFGSGQLLADEKEKLAALKVISDKIMPGRWEDARGPNEQEMKATAVAQIQIESASAKIRTGDPVDDPEDLDLPVWSGVIPIESRLLKPLADEHSRQIDLPDYLTSSSS